ncbi:integrin alpha-M isoform X2 [Pangasianodon hypophthalmus]|uniref:integrin alpha-M isoform X2 n=1 Tax=Pangasianodon hypophthalmus TaxID=310915 RepID=UPI00230707B7|nr:integrin alpha-M isoform X2 [Pangasianodon hypophthalmus]
MALLFMLLCAVSLSDGFNIDVLNPEQFIGNKEDFFGYRLLQYQSDKMKQIIVSAPLSANRSGAIFKCTVEKGNCSHLYQPDLKAIRFFGMSMAVRTSPSATLTSCSPSFTHECDGNSYLNGICYQFNSKLNTVTNIAAFQECTRGKVNLVFLFDGSSSMQASDFDKNKKFIWDVVTKLKNSSIEFAAVQFSKTFSTVFTFKDYVNGMAKKKLDEEKHMKSLTNTHKAIDFTLKNLFNNVESGADPEATKALVIITDGSPSDINTNEIQRCEKLNIARFIIGVGKIDNFEKLNKLASEPKESNIFRIENYDGLNGLLDKLQNKIYGIEGAQGRNYREELSQSGFSAASDKDTLILGAVGSDNWRGMLYEVTGSEAGMEIKDVNLNNDSYNGYSVVVGRRDRVSLVFSGAPRSNHSGQVTLFKKMTHKWEAMSNISGEQIGSYFGGSVCVLDPNSDNNTDFLVVGAPLYYKPHPQREGRIYIYRLTQQLKLEKELEISESAQGRFGMTLAAVADLNGDQLQDLAVGAPLEDNQKGAIYIYLGNHEHGIRPKYSQRIAASSISKQLQHFGLAIDGVMDMGQDGLTDIAVGAQGTVLLLNLNKFDCLGSSENAFAIITLNTCFSMTENTNSKGAVKSGLNVSLELNADAVRQDSRAFFIKEEKTSRSLVMSVLLDSEFSCYNHTVYMHSCVKDTVSSVLFRLNFHQSDHQPNSSNSILNIDSKTTAHVEVPFQINCKNRSCVSDLQLDFNFLNSTLLVVDQASFIIHVTLLNKGDDSFNTSVVLFYPPGLSLSIFKTIEWNRRTLSSCGDRDDGALNKTTCSISLPVYRRDTRAVFEGVFRISHYYNWTDSMQMTLVASSDNNGNTSITTVTKTLPVQFSVDVAISPVPELCKTYLNLSLEDKGPKNITLVYKVSNLGLKDLPVAVSFRMPSQTNLHDLHNHTITVSQNVTACNIVPPEKHADCPFKWCANFMCHSFSLDPRSAVQFELRMLISFPNKQQYTGKFSFSEFRKEDDFSVFAQLVVDKKLYHQISSENDTSRFHQAKISVKAELVIPPNMIMIRGTGGGGGFLLLIIIFIVLLKCGFFKRTRHELCEEGNENSAEEEDEVCSAETNGKMEECPSTSEEKPFIPAGGNNVVSENGGRENGEMEKGESVE